MAGQPKRLAFLGPAGTYSEEAAIRYDATAQREPLPSIAAVAAAVETRMADEGIVPIENSLEGSVAFTLDLLIHDSPLLIKQELVLPINHYLLAKPGARPDQIQVIYSHPQALGQCRRFLEQCFPKVAQVASISTAAAVYEALESATPAAAIAPRRAGELAGAEALAQNIQDLASNVTRFVVLAAEDHVPTGDDKTSLCFTVTADRPGALVEVLQVFAAAGINLAKIESRPSKESLGKYVFLVDLEGHRLAPQVAEVLGEVRRRCATLKVFGSYPRFAE